MLLPVDPDIAHRLRHGIGNVREDAAGRADHVPALAVVTGNGDASWGTRLV